MSQPRISGDINMAESFRTPLMDSKSNEGSEKPLLRRTKTSEELYLSYAQNAPKIMLETITARTASALLLLTYAIFIIAFMIDLRNTILGFRDGNKELPSQTCPDIRTLIDSDKSWGCTVNATYANMSSPVWIGYANHFSNIISVGLKVKNNNITAITYNGTTITDDDVIDGVEVRYTVELFACYKNTDCGDVRPGGNIDESWKKVIKMTNQKIKIDRIYQVGDESASATLLGNTFQNQEALPNKGKVRSYLMWVYYEEDINLFSGNSDNVNYKFVNINRPLRKEGNAVLVIVLFFTLIVFGLYVRTLLHNTPNFDKTLPEQKWIIYYFVALILYQNPVYCVICWMKDPDVKAVYTAYIFDAFAQASFFVIWLLFSDGLSRKTSYYSFYIPKYLMGLLIFATSVVVLTLQFPTINAYDDRSPVEAVYNWSYNTKITFCIFSLAFLCLLLIWTLWWCISLWYTASSLQKHPYMSTRYLQLSFRFFFLQATLVTLYYVFQYFVVLYFILEYSPPYQNQSLENITDNINTLFRQQTLNVGKICFLTTYGIILAFFFLPAGSLQRNDAVVVPLSSTYVVTEGEAEDITRSRRRALRKMKNINQYLYNARAEVYCVDLAIELMELSFQAYNDSETLDTGFGYGVMELEDLGYTLIESIFNSEHETVCYVMRNDSSSRIAVVFRGTSTKQHWNDNLNYSQKRINMFEQRLIALDQLDGLQIRNMENSIDETWIRRTMSERFEDPESGGAFSRESTPRQRTASNSDSTNMMDNIAKQAHRVEDGVKQAASAVVGATTGILTTAASYTPFLKNAVESYVHSGFWDAYTSVRSKIHAVLRRELSARPVRQVFFTGHSLGGALATLAALDVSIHTIPRVNRYLMYHDIRKSEAVAGDLDGAASTLESKSPQSSLPELGCFAYHTVTVGMYNFGSPRVGNYHFAALCDKMCPNMFRTVVDGDIVTGIPSRGYKHVGIEVIIDGVGTGSIIIDPSFVERRLRTHIKSSLKAHSLFCYRTGLQGVRDASEHLRAYGALSTGDLFSNSIQYVLHRKKAKKELEAASHRDLDHVGDEEGKEDSVSKRHEHAAEATTAIASEIDKSQAPISNFLKYISEKGGFLPKNEEAEK